MTKKVLYKHINSAVLQAAKERIVFGGNCGFGWCGLKKVGGDWKN